jgi:hypothetical protein
MIDPALAAAYKQTTYEVYTGERIIRLRIGEYNSDIDELLEKYSSKSWVFITAYNPWSGKLSEVENKARQSELIKEISGYRFFPGAGKPDDNDWEPEISVLVLDLPKKETARLISKYQQNAVVTGEKGQAPALCLDH